MTQQILDLALTPRTPLKKALRKTWDDWPLPKNLFGNMYARRQGHSVNEMIDFEMEDYIYFIDNALTLKNLISGLSILSPFADDALQVAEWMSEKEFEEFRKHLPGARKDEEKCEMRQEFMPLLLPEKFMNLLLIAPKAGVSLGVALTRWEEISQKKKRRSPRT